MNNYMNHMWLENVLDPLAPVIASTLYFNMQQQWNLPPHSNPLINMNRIYELPFFPPQDMMNVNPLFFLWKLQRFQHHAPTQQAPMQLNSHTPFPPQELEEIDIVEEIEEISPPTGSFIEISSLRDASLMIFPEREDKKYILNCPVALTKCSFDLHLAMNRALSKYTVVMSPTLRGSQFPMKKSRKTLHPLSPSSPHESTN